MADDAGEEARARAVTTGDESAFAELVERHRRELHVHCYRMLGSFEEAEDRVQEAFLRAWQKRASFEGRSTVRAWLYRIATNACLEVLRRRRPLPLPSDRAGWRPPYSELPWLQPYPDALLDAASPLEEGPDAALVAKETIALAFLATIQLLPPKQRAVLILRDVVRLSAAETAAVLDDTLPAVNSALQRARATLQRYQGSEATKRQPSTPSDAERSLVRRYMEAHERADPAAVIALLREDARLTLSPQGLHWDGRETITPDFMDGMTALGEFRCVAVRANRQPAVAHYLRRWGDNHFRAFTLVVLEIEDEALVEMTAFARPELFAAFGLPPTTRPRPARTHESPQPKAGTTPEE